MPTERELRKLEERMEDVSGPFRPQKSVPGVIAVILLLLAVGFSANQEAAAMACGILFLVVSGVFVVQNPRWALFTFFRLMIWSNLFPFFWVLRRFADPRSKEEFTLNFQRFYRGWAARLTLWTLETGHRIRSRLAARR